MAGIAEAEIMEVKNRDSNLLSYDEVYMQLWEMAQRFGHFVNFRVIGRSHDERMIPMLEIGKGNQALFVITGMKGSETSCVGHVIQMIGEYCNYYENRWEMKELYNIRELLDKIRLCVIPMVNPDGYEIYQRGYKCIRNPVFRQLLMMQEISFEEYEGNARNVLLEKNFPLRPVEDNESILHKDEENETRALMNIFQEYQGAGLLMIGVTAGKIIHYRSCQLYSGMSKEMKIGRHLKNLIHYKLEADKTYRGNIRKNENTGNVGQYFANVMRRPAFRIELQDSQNEWEECEKIYKKSYETIKTIPLEFIFSI